MRVTLFPDLIRMWTSLLSVGPPTYSGSEDSGAAPVSESGIWLSGCQNSVESREWYDEREDMDQYDTETGAAAAEEITDDDGVTVQMVQQHN